MKAITVQTPGDADVLRLTEVPEPTPEPDEVVVDVAAAGVNPADVLQRKGRYPVPPGASPYLGLEVSGRIVARGAAVTDWSDGDEVCALLAGGGYAERVAVPAGQLLPIPRGVDVVTAAGLPEVACTVWSNLDTRAGLRAGEVLLVHGGTGGIGTMALQLAAARGVRVLATGGSEEKRQLARQLGADVTIDYRTEDFVARVAEETDGHGADVILDVVGAKYLGQNVDALAQDGRLVVIGLQGGRKAELDLGTLLTKRATVTATALRGRTARDKAAIVAEVREHVWPLLESGTIRPVVDRIVPLAEAADAHRAMEDSGAVGKILLRR